MLLCLYLICQLRIIQEKITQAIYRSRLGRFLKIRLFSLATYNSELQFANKK